MHGDNTRMPTTDAPAGHSKEKSCRNKDSSSSLDSCKLDTKEKSKAHPNLFPILSQVQEQPNIHKKEGKVQKNSIKL